MPNVPGFPMPKRDLPSLHVCKFGFHRKDRRKVVYYGRRDEIRFPTYRGFTPTSDPSLGNYAPSLVGFADKNYGMFRNGYILWLYLYHHGLR